MSESGDGKDMHPRVSWMTAGDAIFLEFLYCSRLSRGGFSEQTPRTIAVNTGYSRQYASSRCGVLSDKGLVEHTDHGLYRLSELGRRAIENELSIREMNEL